MIQVHLNQTRLACWQKNEYKSFNTKPTMENKRRNWWKKLLNILIHLVKLAKIIKEISTLF